MIPYLGLARAAIAPHGSAETGCPADESPCAFDPRRCRSLGTIRRKGHVMQQRIYKRRVRTPAREFFEELESTQEDERRAAEKRLNAVLMSATTVLADIERETS